MSKQYFNCHQGPKHYFNNPEFNEPCCCATNSLKQVIQILLNDCCGYTTAQDWIFTGSTESNTAIDPLLLTLLGDLVIFDATAKQPSGLAPLCNLKAIEFYVADAAITKFETALLEAFPPVTKCNSQVCCCSDDLVNAFLYYQAQGADLDNLTFVLDAVYSNSGVLNSYTFNGEVVTLDCNVAIVKISSDDPNPGTAPTGYTGYIVVPLCAIDFIR